MVGTDHHHCVVMYQKGVTQHLNQRLLIMFHLPNLLQHLHLHLHHPFRYVYLAIRHSEVRNSWMYTFSRSLIENAFPVFPPIIFADNFPAIFVDSRCSWHFTVVLHFIVIFAFLSKLSIYTVFFQVRSLNKSKQLFAVAEFIPHCVTF